MKKAFNCGFACLCIAGIALLSIRLVHGQGTCRRSEISPWYYPWAPNTTNSFQWTDFHNPAITVLDVIDPVPVRVCGAGGPSNAIAADVRLKNGKAGTIEIPQNSCTDIEVPHVQIKPGCVSPGQACAPAAVKWKCLYDVPDGTIHTDYTWSRGWYLVSPAPNNTLMKNSAQGLVYYHPNPEQTMPRQYFYLSEVRRTLKLCVSGNATVNLALNDPLSADPDLTKQITGCQFVQAKSIWVLPEQVSAPFSTVSYTVTWAKSRK